ncbi:hypothetical protein NDU88_005810 [Pleurodeles waltl]|uniref:Uncharacterized protein n=1 Tax=Pleurodeles waltl TaxID=8319 RepID=A0AAV7WCK1_PLEWA|nr:hypothetical protein NDU88_005810 [Pleurodeles waltl]
MRGAARAPGGLLSCPCLPGWLECFPWPMAIGVLLRRPGTKASRLKSGTGVRSGAAALCGAPATGPNLGPDLPLDTCGAAEEPQ